MKYLVAGLGNPGIKYKLTRHNIGFLVLDKLAVQEDLCFEANRHAETASFKYKGRNIYLIKPTTYMNSSGKAVNYWLQQLNIPKTNLLVIVDDIALPFGKIRMRAKGSSAGHNGLKDIEQATGGANYPRLRFGIGNSFYKGQQVDYVLSNFNEEEMVGLPDMIDRSIDMIFGFAAIGIQRTMSQFND